MTSQRSLNNLSLSVIVPTYNRAASLSVTLNGLLLQSYPADQFEVIIVSDGSTDGTAAVVEAYRGIAKNDVIYIEQVNGGPSAARNRAINAASNEVVVFVDDDVEPVPSFLERHAVHHLDSDTSAIVGPMLPDSALSFREPVWIAWEHEKLMRVYQMFQDGGEFASSEAGPMHFYSGNASIKRKWLLAAGGFDTKYNRQEDVELAVRLAGVFGVHFYFDFDAVGVHRPCRTFESWLKIPRDYGRLDAQRLAEGTIHYSDIRSNLENRHALTRLVTRIVAAGPPFAQSMNFVLRTAALLTGRFGMRSISLKLLSGLYNGTYYAAFLSRRRNQASRSVVSA